jgi:hypothetical protein
MKKLLMLCLLLMAGSGVFAQQPNYRDMPDTIWVHVSDAYLAPELADGFRLAAQASFLKVNQRKKQQLKFMLTDDWTAAHVRMELLSYHLATRADKTSALLLTMVGVGGPILLAAAGVPFPVAFYSSPHNHYLTAVSYNPDFYALGFADIPEVKRKVSTGYASSDRKNEGKIAADFGSWMEAMGKKWNKKHLKTSRAVS